MRFTSASVRRSVLVSGIVIAVAGPALSGCGSGPGGSASPPPAATPASAAPAGTAAGGTSTTSTDPKALCRGLPAADVAALFSGPVGPVQPGIGSATCAYAPAGKGGDIDASLSVVIDTTYGAATYPGTASAMGASPQPISGVGDKAAWASSQPGFGAPNVAAVRGNTSCYLQSPSDVSVLALPTTGDARVSDAAAAAYARKLAVLCADVFAGQ
jgi:hypothetical protein